MNLAGSSLCVRVISPPTWLPPFLQTVLDLGRMRGTVPFLAMASQIFLVRYAESGDVICN